MVVLGIRKLVEGSSAEKKASYCCAERGFFLVQTNIFFENLINAMRERNIYIPDGSASQALALLETISYSSLVKGYKDTPLVNQKGIFIEPISLFELSNLYLIDSDFSSIIFKNILHIEKFFKTKLSNNISFFIGEKTYDNSDVLKENDDYLCAKNYEKSDSTESTLLYIKKLISNPIKTSTLEYYKNKKGAYPPWIVCDNITFSTALSWYKILKPNIKYNIIGGFLHNHSASNEENKELFVNMMNCLVRYRNKIAHNNTIFKIKDTYKITRKALVKYTNNTLCSNSLLQKYDARPLYLLIVSIAILLNDPVLYENFLIELNFVLKKYSDKTFCGISLYELLGIPEDIIEGLTLFYEYNFENNF